LEHSIELASLLSFGTQTEELRVIKLIKFVLSCMNLGLILMRCQNVPFWMSSRGYGIFIDTPDKVDLEIGSERCCRVQTSVEGQRLKWYVPCTKSLMSIEY